MESNPVFLFLQVVYFTALFPYMILIIFFGRAVTLKGAGVGLAYMFTPDVSEHQIF